MQGSSLSKHSEQLRGHLYIVFVSSVIQVVDLPLWKQLKRSFDRFVVSGHLKHSVNPQSFFQNNLLETLHHITVLNQLETSLKAIQVLSD